MNKHSCSTIGRLTLSFLLLGCTSFILSGCVSPQQYSYSYQVKNITPKFSITDSRPDVEKHSKLLSYNALNKLYGIYRIGDPELTPDRMLYLTEKLSEQCGDELEGKRVEVKQFEVLNNQKTYLQGMAMAMQGAPGFGGKVWVEVHLKINVESNSYSSESLEYYDIYSVKQPARFPLGPVVQLAIDSAASNIVEQIKGIQQLPAEQSSNNIDNASTGPRSPQTPLPTNVIVPKKTERVTKEKQKASVHPALNTHDTQPSSEVEDSRTINKLRSLKQLKDEGILTEDEFEQRRKALVDTL